MLLLVVRSVASVFLADVDLPGPHRGAIVDHMVVVHQSVRQMSADFEAALRRHNYVTPKNYLDFVGTYKAGLRGPPRAPGRAERAPGRGAGRS